MKYSIAIATLTTALFTSTSNVAWGFAPTSSFTTFSQNHQNNVVFRHQQRFNSNASRARKASGSGTEMRMMFDQLATAISDVAKSIGGRSRYVI